MNFDIQSEAFKIGDLNSWYGGGPIFNVNMAEARHEFGFDSDNNWRAFYPVTEDIHTPSAQSSGAQIYKYQKFASNVNGGGTVEYFSDIYKVADASVGDESGEFRISRFVQTIVCQHIWK